MSSTHDTFVSVFPDNIASGAIISSPICSLSNWAHMGVGTQIQAAWIVVVVTDLSMVFDMLELSLASRC